MVVLNTDSGLPSRDLFKRVVAVINGKGGVGKTSTVANTGGMLAAAGWRVLLVDFDPQGNLGRDLGVRYTDRDDDGAAMFAAAPSGRRSFRSPTSTGLDLVCGGGRIAEMSGALHRRRRSTPTEAALRDVLVQIAGNYHLILIDCPPGEEELQRTALQAAARHVVIPTKADSGSLDGLVRVAQLFGDAKAGPNPDIDLLGVLLFGIDAGSTRIAKSARDTVGRELGDPDVFEARIRHAEGAPVQLPRPRQTAFEVEASSPPPRPRSSPACAAAGRAANTEPTTRALASPPASLPASPATATRRSSLQLITRYRATDRGARMTRPPISNLAGHRDLAGAIGAPPEAVAVPPPAVAAESTPQIAAAGEKAPRSRRKAPTEDDTTKRAVPIYLPAALLAQLRVATTATGESYSDSVLDGYEMVHDRLGERFAPVATRRSGLPPRRRAARRHVENPVAVQLRFTGAELPGARAEARASRRALAVGVLHRNRRDAVRGRNARGAATVPTDAANER